MTFCHLTLLSLIYDSPSWIALINTNTHFMTISSVEAFLNGAQILWRRKRTRRSKNTCPSSPIGANCWFEGYKSSIPWGPSSPTSFASKCGLPPKRHLQRDGHFIIPMWHHMRFFFWICFLQPDAYYTHIIVNIKENYLNSSWFNIIKLAWKPKLEVWFRWCSFSFLYRWFLAFS